MMTTTTTDDNTTPKNTTEAVPAPPSDEKPTNDSTLTEKKEETEPSKEDDKIAAVVGVPTMVKIQFKVLSTETDTFEAGSVGGKIVVEAIQGDDGSLSFSTKDDSFVTGTLTLKEKEHVINGKIVTKEGDDNKSWLFHVGLKVESDGTFTTVELNKKEPSIEGKDITEDKEEKTEENPVVPEPEVVEELIGKISTDILKYGGDVVFYQGSNEEKTLLILSFELEEEEGEKNKDSPTPEKKDSPKKKESPTASAENDGTPPKKAKTDESSDTAKEEESKEETDDDKETETKKD
jgi:hypothetical protein